MRWILLIYSAFLVVRAVSVLTPAFEAVDRVFFIYSLPHAIAVGCSAILAAARFRLGQEEIRRARLDLSNQMLATVADEQTSRRADEQTNLVRLLSHEIKGPLSRAFGSLSDQEASTKQHLKEIQRWLDRLDEDRELSGILDQPEFHKITVNALVDRFSRLKPTFQRDIGTTILHCDPFLVITALENLMDNALKYGGEATMNISKDAEGIPYYQHELAFKRFSRLNASSAVGGTGQGLFWSRQIARVHGGDVLVKSRQPSVVQLWLPH